MTAPTREELAALADVAGELAEECYADETDSATVRQETEEARSQYLRIALLLRTYPLPVAEGERERLAADLVDAADALEALEWAGPLDCDQCVGEPAPCCILCGATKDEGHFTECGAANGAQVRCAAALLRAPAAAIRGYWFDATSWVCGDCGYLTQREQDLCSKCARPNRPPMIRERTPAGASTLVGLIEVSSAPIGDGERFVNVLGPSFGFSLQVEPEVEAALREMVDAHNRLTTAPAEPPSGWCECGHRISAHDMRAGGGGRCHGAADDGGCLCCRERPRDSPAGVDLEAVLGEILAHGTCAYEEATSIPERERVEEAFEELAEAIRALPEAKPT